MDHFKKYTFGNAPNSLPVRAAEVATLDGRDASAVGFSLDDEEVCEYILTQEWNGHPSGSRVLSGLFLTGYPFAVFSPESPSA